MFHFSVESSLLTNMLRVPFIYFTCRSCGSNENAWLWKWWAAWQTQWKRKQPRLRQVHVWPCLLPIDYITESLRIGNRWRISCGSQEDFVWLIFWNPRNSFKATVLCANCGHGDASFWANINLGLRPYFGYFEDKLSLRDGGGGCSLLTGCAAVDSIYSLTK